MLAYLLKVTICWAVFYLLYHLLLGKETFFRLNRWYLLATVLLGLAFPAIELDLIFGPEEVPLYYLQPITVGVDQLQTIIVTASAEERPIDFWQILVWIYWAGVAVAMLRFGYGLFQIFKLYRTGQRRREAAYRFIATPLPHVPFSFFKNLFWSKYFEVGEEDRHHIVRHEEAHIFQWHSMDVLLLELAGVFCWCSPLIYLYKKAVKTTHEYLADAYVTEGFNKKQYGRLLLRQSQSGMQIAISNSLFSSQLKKRIVMMTKTRSSQWATLKYLAALPIVAVLLLAFSFVENPINPMQSLELQRGGLENFPTMEMPAAKDTIPERKAGTNEKAAPATAANDVHQKVDEMPRFPGCEEIADANERNECAQTELFNFIFKNLKYPAAAKEQGTEGMVVVKFVIENDGSIYDADILKSVGNGCDEEVLRLIQMMPNWIPAKKGGKNVAMEFHLPIKFKLDSGAEKTVQKEVDEMPRFPGCESADDKVACSNNKLINFIGENLKYPEKAKNAGVEGMVVVKFVVGEDGKLYDFDVKKGIGGGCDEEALRVVQQMPEWVPGQKDGKPVATEMNLPFKFALDKNAAQKAEIFEVFPNPSNEQGFNVRFKAPAGKLSLVFYDANKKGDVIEKEFPKYDGTEQTVRIGTSGLFSNGVSKGTAFVGLYDEKGNVLGSTTVVVQ